MHSPLAHTGHAGHEGVCTGRLRDSRVPEAGAGSCVLRRCGGAVGSHRRPDSISMLGGLTGPVAPLKLLQLLGNASLGVLRSAGSPRAMQRGGSCELRQLKEPVRMRRRTGGVWQSGQVERGLRRKAHPSQAPALCPQGQKATHGEGVRSEGGHAPAHLVLAATQGDQGHAAQPDLRRCPGHTGGLRGPHQAVVLGRR